MDIPTENQWEKDNRTALQEKFQEYLKDMGSDADRDKSEIENYKTWAEMEYEEVFHTRCSKCDSLNTTDGICECGGKTKAKLNEEEKCGSCADKENECICPDCDGPEEEHKAIEVKPKKEKVTIMDCTPKWCELRHEFKSWIDGTANQKTILGEQIDKLCEIADAYIKLTKTKIPDFEKMVNDADNTRLYEMRELIDKEIRLSETCIKEGEEKRK
jgi:hypothetical protein